MRNRIVLVVLITAALLAAAGWAGVLSLVLDADRVHAVPVIGALVLLGLWKGWRGDWQSSEWWARKLPYFGLFLTGYGILTVYPEVLGGADYSIRQAHTIMALLPNCIAAAGIIWLLVLRRVCDR